MCDNLAKLLESIEPKIQDIQERRVELKSLEAVHNSMQELVELGQESYLGILDYSDQNFILKAIKIRGSDSEQMINKYQSSRYLLKSTDPNLRDLPQFKDSVSYMENLYKYLSGLNDDIALEFEEKSEELKVQEILNKYYFLLAKDNIFIEDVSEFLIFLDLCHLDLEEKLSILILINQYNIKNYVTTNDIKLTNDIRLSDVSKFIEDNKLLLEREYNNTDDISLPLVMALKKNNITDELLDNRRIYLYHKIYEMYENKRYSDLLHYYIEYRELLGYEEEFQKQKLRTGRLVFLINQDKSFLREQLENLNIEYQNCIFKNLLDLEQQKDLQIPNLLYNNTYLYLKDEFVVKTIYTYLNNGDICIIGLLGKDENINDFLSKYKDIIDLKLLNINTQEYDENERNMILKDIRLEDLVLTIDLDTLNVKSGG